MLQEHQLKQIRSTTSFRETFSCLLYTSEYCVKNVKDNIFALAVLDCVNTADKLVDCGRVLDKYVFDVATVSYTHLDVYKRQERAAASEQPVL